MWRYPLAPTVTSTSSPFHFLAGDHLVIPIGASHISLRHKKYNQGSGRKEQRTNEQYGLVQLQGQEDELCNTAFPMHM